MSLKCYYHPDIDAQSKCENCGKIICLECKKSFTKTHGTFESKYSTRHEFCMPCYFDSDYYYRQIKSAQSGGIFIVIIIFFIIGLVISIIMFDLMMLVFTIVCSIGIIGSIRSFIIKKYIKGPKIAEKLEAQKEEYLESVKISSSGKQKITPSSLKNFCSNCGSQIEPNISICPNCGSEI